MKRGDILEFIIWGSLIYLLIFVILKILGIIKTPAFWENSPFLVGATFGISGYK
jgi:hypothetical protein